MHRRLGIPTVMVWDHAVGWRLDTGGTCGRPPAHRRSVEPCHTFSRNADVQIATKAKQLDALLEQVTKQKAELQALKAVKKA